MLRRRLIRRVVIAALGLIGVTGIVADESRFSLDNRRPEAIISGDEMQSWVICYQDFLSIEDLSDEQKDLEHYEMYFYDDEEYWVIYFVPKLLPDERKWRRLKRMTFGRGTTYWVNKETMRIVKRLFDA